MPQTSATLHVFASPNPHSSDQRYTACVCVAQPPLLRPALHCYTVSPSPISLHCSSAFFYNSWLMERFQRRLERLRQHHNKCASRFEQTFLRQETMGERSTQLDAISEEKNWRNSVSVTAHQTIQEKRWNKDDDIPLTKNVIALRDHLRMVEDEARKELTEQMDLHAYKTLNESVLAQVIIFNKRREGEASRLTLDVYMKASTSAINEDIYKTLSPLEKQLSKLLTRIEIRGKRGKKVPVFLTKRMKASIDLLVQKRVEAGVPAENPYLFARPGVMTNIRGCDCLRKYAKKSKAENPELLRSTKLRKQVATLCQLLDLSEQELEQVSRFMGHDIRVHRDFYRQTDKTFQIAKISKLLFAMEQGTQTLRGKNLNTLAPACGEGPTLNSVGVSPRTKKKRVKLAEDGGSDLSSPEKTRQSCHEADGSDVNDDCSGANLKKKPTPNKNRRRRQTKSGETKYEGFDLSSPEKRLKSCHEADGSDVDDDCSGANLKKNPTPNKKRPRQTKSGETKYGGSDLSSPEKRLKSCHEADGSDVDDDCSGANLKKKPTPNKNRRRRRQTKSGETKDGGADLSFLEKRLKSCREDGSSESDVDDECSGANLLKKTTPNKKIGRQTKSAKVSAKVNVKRPWSEAERSAVHKHLAKFIAERRVPGKLPCMKCIEEEEALNERSWKDVKNFVYNTIVTLNRRSASRKLKF
ncbi:uncharacterized protein [Misgurnus anguillicaudatus]|uniref:uncharacterized protein n=1 Tax=Misgurnus anguillicaudatus TaxID=75329 RepID=UPI003CCF6F97